jgi:hypothetical protein
LDFSGGPIHLEEIFRVTDLIDENSPSKLIHRINSLGAMSAGGKKKKKGKVGLGIWTMFWFFKS